MGVDRWIAVVVIGLAAALTLDPATLGLSTYAPVTQIIAMRGLVAIGFFVLALVVLLIAGLTGLIRKSAPVRLIALAAVMALIAAGHAGVLATRGIVPRTLDARSNGIEVLTLNTLGGSVDADELAAYLVEERPDVVALQEAPAGFVSAVVAALDAVEGRDPLPGFQVFLAGDGAVGSTALLVSTDLGEYGQTDGPLTTFGTVWAAPFDGDGPVLLSVHLVPPATGNMDAWRTELQWITDLCDTVPNLVIAGDFNATYDHAPMRRCTDAARGAGGVGTWPTHWPALLGAPIDHVVVDPEAWRGLGARVVTLGGSDHRAVLVRITAA